VQDQPQILPGPGGLLGQLGQLGQGEHEMVLDPCGRMQSLYMPVLCHCRTE
jgi:hypothetical protein